MEGKLARVSSRGRQGKGKAGARGFNMADLDAELALFESEIAALEGEVRERPVPNVPSRLAHRQLIVFLLQHS